MRMTDKKKPAADVVTSTPRLKKDGTPDGRANNSGKVGNRGNRTATGRKKLPGSEPRTNLLLYTSDSEYAVMQDFCHILKDDRETAEKILTELGTPPPEGKKPPIRKRKSHGIRLTDSEKELARIMLAITKDRLTVAKMAVESAKIE
jgi:hypothetical protein